MQLDTVERRQLRLLAQDSPRRTEAIVSFPIRGRGWKKFLGNQCILDGFKSLG